jgi:hypothetical protein
MRKRTVTARTGIVTTAFTFVLLVVACGRRSDTSNAASVGSSTESSAVAGAPAVARAPMAQQAEGMTTRAEPDAPPALEVAVAGAATKTDAALPLGSLASTDPSGAMLIRSGQASVEVHRLDDAMTKVRQTASQLGGFVANMNLMGGKDEHRSAQIELRIPSAQFDAAVVALGTLGKVESVSASVQDAGDEYVDLGARAANARHMEARLVEMLARRTGKLSEALTVEQELRRVREEIERYDARLKWLERKAALSSLQITLHEPVSVLDQRGPSPIAEAFAEAWRRAVGVLAWCIASLGVIVPLGLLIGGMIVLARRWPGFGRAA